MLKTVARIALLGLLTHMTYLVRKLVVEQMFEYSLAKAILLFKHSNSVKNRNVQKVTMKINVETVQHR